MCVQAPVPIDAYLATHHSSPMNSSMTTAAAVLFVVLSSFTISLTQCHQHKSCRNGQCTVTPDFAYADLCDQLSAERQERSVVDIVYWTSPMLDIFHRAVGKCTSETAPECDVDADFSATFRRACRDGGVPCLLDVPAPDRRVTYANPPITAHQCRRFGLDYDCVVRESRADILHPDSLLGADVVLFDGTNTRVWGTGIYPPYKCADQLWTMFEFRPAAVYPFLRDASYLAHFDVTAGYSRNWTLWMPDYAPTPDFFTKLVPPEQKRNHNPVMVMISQCDTPNKRILYVEQLAEHIGVDSYGKCLRNAEWPAELLAQHGNKYAQKAVIMRRYRFYLAFENSNEPDYVSEKIYNALAEGVVPVYMGAPNVALYTPSRSFINAADFETPAALAAYLKHLLATPAEYDAYLAWKRAPPEPHMLELERNSRSHHYCRICAHAKDERQKRAKKKTADKTEL
jgi:hypothetical protein